MKKKFLSTLACLVVVAIAALTLTACGDKAPKDTAYKGRISTETYANVDAAATAFMRNELSQEGVFVSYESGDDLTEKELAELAVDETLRAEITAGEKGTVTYRAASNLREAAQSADKTAQVYILQCADAYRYYAPALKAGDRLTSGYFAEIFDESKYLNCTFRMEMDVEMSMKQGPMTSETKTSTDATLKCADKYVYITVKAANQTAEFFFVCETDMRDLDTGNYTAYSKVGDGAWEVYDSFGGATDPDQIIGSFGEPTIGYEGFIKTDSGFKLDPDMMAALLEGIADEIDPSNVKASATFTVRDGKLDTGKMSADLQMEGEEDGVQMAMKLKYAVTMRYSAFGTTTVTVPEGLSIE